MSKLKNAAEYRLQQSIEAAVITVPASFNSRQRQATLEAAGLAGFDQAQISLIDEPTAAVLDYIVKQIRRQTSYISFEQPQKLMVFDMGGGTLDVSIIQTEPQGNELSLRILARSRYTELAGNDLDLRLAAYLLNIFQEINQQQVTALPLRRQREVMSSLLNLAEELKRLISARLKESMVYWEDLSRLKKGAADVRIPHLGREFLHGEKLVGHLPELLMAYNTHFKRIWEPFFSQDQEQMSTIYAPIASALAEAFPNDPNPHQQIDLVLLHGGTCMLPVIGSMVQEYFPGVRVDETPDLMNSVARGAVIYDVMLHGPGSGAFGDIRMRQQPVFEAVFLERYRHGLTELVPKTAAPGEEKEIPLSIPEGRPSRLPISLYHGFSANDPFVTLDQELAIMFDVPPREGETIYLGWRVLTDRTIEYWWRPDQGERQQLRRLGSRGREVTNEEYNLTGQRTMLEKLKIY
ncbi:MAG: Hsp70 family protein [Anaerolineales bacterium]|nr:Hsp70 family protein [Anaerolineales bacterium]